VQKRERYLATAVALLLGAWIADSFIIQSSLRWFADMDKQTRAAEQQVGEAKVLIDRQAKIMGDWRALHAAGLLDNSDQARFRVQTSLAKNASASGFVIDSISSGQVIPASSEQHYDVLRLGISGRGTHKQCVDFIALLEHSAMPLLIERSEMSASDGRKEQLDVAMTVSTRMVAEHARAGRSLPDGVIAWQPAVRDTQFDTEILAAKPFASDRRPARAENTAAEKPPEKKELPAPKPIDPGWALTGIVLGQNSNAAFIRHLGNFTERQISIGDIIDERTITAITHDHLVVTHGDEKMSIAVGYSLRGESVSVLSALTAKGSAKTSQASTSSAPSTRDKKEVSENDNKKNEQKPPATPFSVPPPAGDAAREAILERLRQQRGSRTP
jgi:hypothetical protein